jgi:hypothetical protein
LITPTPLQQAISTASLEGQTFLEGPAGTGKTTAGASRLLHLLQRGLPGDVILVWVPQRTLAIPYYEALQTTEYLTGWPPTVVTIGGLARRMVNLFWPLIAEEAGFARPDQPPTFLTLETAQYYMAHLVRPLLDEGYFSAVTIKRARLYSQIIDNLNKAAAVGFPHTEISACLADAGAGDLTQSRIYHDAQDCADRFRQYCLENNLLDFSLQLELFTNHLWTLPLCREHLIDSYRHLIIDNLEEDVPVAHDILHSWIPAADSALVIYDHQAGYRRFLGADPDSAYTLAERCEEQVEFSEPFTTPEPLATLGEQLGVVLRRPDYGPTREPADLETTRTRLDFEVHNYFPEMLQWVGEKIADLVENENVPPGEIAVLAPFLPDSLRFSIMYQLEELGIPARSHRPSRALRDEPVAECLLTLAQLAHPDWGFKPTPFDVAYALVQAVAELDLVRGQLLAEALYASPDSRPTLLPFDEVKPEVQGRITYLLGGRYEGLRTWLEAYRHAPAVELDVFLGRIFGELLSQPGYGFHNDFRAGETTANLIESVQKFRWAAGDILLKEDTPLGKEYIEMVQEGVIAAQYIRSWSLEPEEAVLLAPAYTFLMRNRPVDYQFWLDVGSRGWHERLFQPLTHPYVLSRWWEAGQPWLDAHEVEAEEDALFKLTLGLFNRCRKGIFLGLSEMNNQGYAYQGQLLLAIQRALQRLPA